MSENERYELSNPRGGGGAFLGIRGGGALCSSPNPDASTYFRSMPIGQM